MTRWIGKSGTGITMHDTAHDPVNHPEHYCMGGIEVLAAIEAWDLPYHLGNVVKYVARAGKKDPDTYLQDLEKARFYLDRYIERMKK